MIADLPGGASQIGGYPHTLSPAAYTAEVPYCETAPRSSGGQKIMGKSAISADTQKGREALLVW